LRFIGNSGTLPTSHTDYLVKIRDQYNYNPIVVYDIGACVLHWTKAAKKVWVNAEVVAFDAMDSAEILYQEAGMKYNIGLLSDTDGREIEFYQNDFDPGGNSYYVENSDINPAAKILYTESHKRKLKSITLDSAVLAGQLPLPDLIKMDVQGSELDILKGATETLKTVNHVILGLQMIEYNKGAPLHNEVIAYMSRLGFECTGMFCDKGPDGDYHFVRK